MSKRYLTVLAGSPRGGELTWQSLYINVLNHLNSDLAICTGNKWLNNQSFIKRAKYLWNFEEPEDWFEYYRENFQGNWEEYFNLGKSTGLYNSGSIHFALKDIILRNHSKVFKEYDTIIYTRFDQHYVDYHPKIITDEIYIPEGQDYFGICDRHAAFPSKYSNKFLNICGYIDNPKSLLTKRSYVNCETTFKDHMDDEGLKTKIKRYPRSQFTASLKGEHTNWRIAKYKIYFFGKIMMKYPDEFIDSISNIKEKDGLLMLLLRRPVLTFNYLYLLLRRLLGKLKSAIL